MQKKLVVLFVLVLLAFLGLGIRLIWISHENGTKYNKEILKQQDYSSVTLPFKRGEIVDSKGVKLAVSEKYYNLVIDASVINYDEKYVEPTLQALEACYPQLDMQEIRKHVTTNKESKYYIPLKLLNFEQKQAFEEYKTAKAEENEKDLIKGIWFEEVYQRIYPHSTLACDVIGFTGKDNTGTYGLEEYYNDILNGTNGREYGYLGDDSLVERTIKPAVDGYTIHSTIDVNIQKIVENKLYEFNEANKNAVREGNGAENVGCIIMEVDTGRILAMASYPNFDLNNIKDPTKLLGNVMVDANGKQTGGYITQADLDAMDDATLYQNLNYLWKNFCISDTYEPGSTAKPFTVATALECGAITGNEVYQCNGKLHIGGHDIHCHVRTGEGAVNVQSSIAWSCNVAMMHMGQAIGKTNFAKFQQIFNFGLKTNVDLAGEARTVDLLFDEKMGDADLATNTFGQNFNVTMIQMVAGFSSLINGGYYYEPHLVDKITDSKGAIVENIEPRVLKQTVSAATSEKLVQYCTAVVMPEGGNQRTGKTARPAGYAIGGKTGTAQTLPRGNKEYVVSFMGFAPADDPEIAIYVVVDRPNAAKQDDAKFATRIVRSVLTEVLPYLNIYMTEELSESEIAELEALQLENTYGKVDETLEQEAMEGLNDGTGQGNTTYEEPEWKSYEKDPATGYLKDPVTGALLDPDTGEVLVGDSIPAIDW
ncbi:MAG: cell division protein FtsI [Lachnospiraceae bacterium]|nr:cell division protein FtsI [Lachnospiraceae bacterium]